MLDKEKILEAAQKYVLKGQSKKAIKEYLRLIEASPKDKRVYLKLGDLYLKEGETGKALKEYMNLAQLYAEDDLNFRAISVYKKILSIEPRHVEAHRNLAKLYLREGLVGSARTYYQSILEIRPDDRDASEGLREIEGRQAVPSSVESPFPVEEPGRGAVSPSSDKDAETHYHLGIAYKEMELFDYAVSEFERASSNPSVKFDSFIMLGECYKERGDYEKSIEYFKMASRITGLSNEKLARLHFNLGLAYEGNGMTTEALDTFHQVLKLDPSFSEAQKKIQRLQHLQK